MRSFFVPVGFVFESSGKQMDISTSSLRQKALKSILPVDAIKNHELLKEILQLEMAEWRSESGYENKENLFHCGFLLHIVGDYEDVETMCEARNINLDSSCGFDVQNLVGGGVEETIDLLEAAGKVEVAEEIKAAYYYKDFDDLPKWISNKIKYYYPEL